MNEEFEKWASKHQTMDGYPTYSRQDAWRAAWLASRKQTIEECAAICDKINNDEWHAFKTAPLDDQRRGGDYTQGKSDGAEDCADAIRALQKE